MTIAVLGAGVAGMSAAYRLKQLGLDAAVYEASDHWGGLCRSFEVDGFRFDTFGHISFDKSTQNWLEGRVPCYNHPSRALNYSFGRWLKHPLQEHLSGLPVEERVQIIADFVNRTPEADKSSDYGEWLKRSYGVLFAERYPYRYTRKYWTVEPECLEPRWVSGRMSPTTLEQMLRGAMDDTAESTHYSKVSNYPRTGGFQNLLSVLADGLNIQTGKRVVSLDTQAREISFSDGTAAGYDALISTLPLPVLCAMLKNVPKRIRHAADYLHHTSGVTVSVGLSKKNVSPAMWFYIYDEDILPARINSPSWCSPDNVPEGCGSVQAEVYYSSLSPRTDPLETVKQKCVEDMIRMGLFAENDIVTVDVREHPYANIMFTKDIYRARETIHNYLSERGVEYAGRFGEWDYLWVGQSLKSGFAAADRVLRQAQE